MALIDGSSIAGVIAGYAGAPTEVKRQGQQAHRKGDLAHDFRLFTGSEGLPYNSYEFYHS